MIGIDIHRILPLDQVIMNQSLWVCTRVNSRMELRTGMESSTSRMKMSISGTGRTISSTVREYSSSTPTLCTSENSEEGYGTTEDK